MDIRRLNLDDLDEYFEIRLKALQVSPAAFLSSYEEEKLKGKGYFETYLSNTDHNRVILAAVLQNKIAATIGLYKEDKIKNQHKAQIWGMFVDPIHRGTGIGSQLLDFAINFAKNNMNAETLSLSVESSNKSAIKLYESRGFKLWGTEPKAIKIGNQFLDDNHMVLIFNLDET